MTLLERLLRKHDARVIAERDERWARAVKESFFLEGGHPLAGGTVGGWNQSIYFANGVMLDANLGIIEYKGAKQTTEEYSRERYVTFG